VAIVIFFLVHWQASVFFQSFFLHRYGAHRQFTMSKRAERIFHLLAWVVMGPSFLSPRAYAILHRMHHAYSDGPKDPHSPIQEPNIIRMMHNTHETYRGFLHDRVKPEPRFDGGYPEWKAMDRVMSSWSASLFWGGVYLFIYASYAHATGHYWVFALLPFHWYLGPIHGAIVNYFGHKLGYRNYDSDDASKNTLVFDVLTAGELFQNNHHKFGQSPNFAVRWFEIDPTYQIMRVLNFVGIIDMSGAQIGRWEKPATPSTLAAHDAAARARQSAAGA
jgi:stearoyl-CoA desaturase (delta-9 desaturase)